MTMTKSNSPRLEQKLRAALTKAAATRDGDRLPDARAAAAEATRFANWSKALHELVAMTCLLAAPGWHTEEWAWDGYCQQFNFHFNTRESLDHHGDMPVFLSARMMFDPQQSLDAELARLKVEAKLYAVASRAMWAAAEAWRAS
jgi:hypothetical protein